MRAPPAIQQPAAIAAAAAAGRALLPAGSRTSAHQHNRGRPRPRWARRCQCPVAATRLQSQEAAGATTTHHTMMRHGAKPEAAERAHTPPPDGVRVACLLPSATEIVGALGLGPQIVAITHECDLCPDADSLKALLSSDAPPVRVTNTTINPHAMSQRSIDDAVKRSVATGLSLYTVDHEALLAAEPSLVITQALCAVCAPDAAEVDAVCVDIARQLRSAAATASAAAAAGSEGGGGGAPGLPAPAPAPVQVLSLQPVDLPSVAESFVGVARACGAAYVPRGLAMRAQFEQQLAAVGAAVAGARPSCPAASTSSSGSSSSSPTVLLLEWLDPVFDAGHWVPGQIEASGCLVARLGEVRAKSTQRSWEDVVAADPDCVLVGCCGFDVPPPSVTT